MNDTLQDTLNVEALEPLYAPWEEPTRHRVKADGGAVIKADRRPSPAGLVRRIRPLVDQWRQNVYVGASATTRTLLLHWFETAHPDDFRYHFCQREAIETMIYLHEVARYRNLGALISSLYDEDETAPPDTEADEWARYCCKIATGGGKTKVMSLAAVWSYFHSLKETGSEMPRHFVGIAPNLIVFERLREDFGSGAIFRKDPLIPPEWASEFDFQVILQDEAGGGSARGTLYLTNIHRLYPREKATAAREDDGPPWAGPTVSKAQALKVGEALRARIAAHPSLMVLNDEAHHLHDPDSAWVEAIATLDAQSRANGNAGVRLQLDFTATPKDPNGALFPHVVSDFPLGEAVDAGIVKVPVIGRADELLVGMGNSAAERYRMHLALGYESYSKAFETWQQTHKPILFVMTESTDAANEVAAYLDSDRFPLLKGRVINLHTKLKGKVKKDKQGNPVFEVNEKQMKDEDLNEVRRLSRDLDEPNSPYRCVVSVLMLREGWDVRNVTTIVPLRAYDSKILAEQTLGRGLRRMTRAGGPLERVTVIEHSSFVDLYEQQLGGEGLFPEIEDPTREAPISVSIFVDGNKPLEDLEIELPRITEGVETTATLPDLSFDEIKAEFLKRHRPLPLGEPRTEPITYEEQSLLTEELVARWEVDRGALTMGFTAPAIFTKEIERMCRLQSAHALLAPLVEQFLQEALFERPIKLFDPTVSHRLADQDVAEHVRAAFVPLILKKIVTKAERRRTETAQKISLWRPYQASMTAERPCIEVDNTMFNLVPCDRDLERQFAEFCGVADDVAAFAKNAGPQKLQIDYIAPNGRPALYAPDFFVRLKDGEHLLVETKGRVDTSVPWKARAAVEWCKTASTKKRKWTYVYLPMAQMEAATEYHVGKLASACKPALQSLLELIQTGQAELPLDATPEEVTAERTATALDAAGLSDLPEELRPFVEQAVNQLAFSRSKPGWQLGAAFMPLLIPLERLCGDILNNRLGPRVPPGRDEQGYYFSPYLGGVTKAQEHVLRKNGENLRRNLVYRSNSNRIGTFLFCLDFADSWDLDPGGIWDDVRQVFASEDVQAVRGRLGEMNAFRGRHVAHVDEPLTDPEVADAAMKDWLQGLTALYALARGG